MVTSQTDDIKTMDSWHNQFMPYEFILKTARETGFLKRLRKLNPVYLIFVLVFGVSSHSKPTFEEIFRRYIDFDENPKLFESMRIQSFRNRFNQNLVNFLAYLLNHYIDVMVFESPARLKESVQDFKDILLQDSSIIRLSRKLFDFFPAARSRDNAAGLKIHAVYSVISHSVKTIEITGERNHDSTILRIGPEVKNMLLINDLGYYSLKVFQKIDEFGGFFVSRVKSNAKATVSGILSCPSFINLNFLTITSTWMDLNEFLETVPKTGIYDLVCSFETVKKSKKANQNAITKEFRVICFWNQEKLVWHIYMTNLRRDNFSSTDIYELYKFRWVIELLFKELKGDYDLGKLLLGNAPLAYVHIYSMLIRLIVSRNLYTWILSSVESKERERYGPMVWSKVFAEKSSEFLSILNQALFGDGDVSLRWKKLEKSLRHLAKSRHKVPRLSQKFTRF
jgi:IS4 transposase